MTPNFQVKPAAESTFRKILALLNAIPLLHRVRTLHLKVDQAVATLDDDPLICPNLLNLCLGHVRTGLSTCRNAVDQGCNQRLLQKGQRFLKS